MITGRSVRIFYKRVFTYFKVILIVYSLIFVATHYDNLAKWVQTTNQGISDKIESLNRTDYGLSNPAPVKNESDESSVLTNNDEGNIENHNSSVFSFDDLGPEGRLLILLILDLYVIKAHSKLLLATQPKRKKGLPYNALLSRPNSRTHSLDNLENDVRVRKYLEEKLKAVKEESIDELIPVYEKELKDTMRSIDECYRILVNTNKAWEARQSLDEVEPETKTKIK